MKAGTAFEHLSAEIFSALRTNPQFESVEHNVQLPGPDGPRQIDVLLRGRVGPIEVLTIIECKDTAKLVTVEEIDALHSKLQDVRAQKGVLVARNGFSKTARQKANRLGINLCTAQQAKHASWPLKEAVPFVIEEISCEHAHVDFEFVLAFNGDPSRIHLGEVSGLSLQKLISDHWNAHEIEFEGPIKEYALTPNIPGPMWMRFDTDGQQQLKEFQIILRLERRYYFGYLNDMESTKCLEFVETGKKHVIFDPAELGNYRSKLARYASREEVPLVERAVMIRSKLLLSPETTFKSTNLVTGMERSVFRPSH